MAETKRKLVALGPIRLEQDQTTAQLQVQKVRRGGEALTGRSLGVWSARPNESPCSAPTNRNACGAKVKGGRQLWMSNRRRQV